MIHVAGSRLQGRRKGICNVNRRENNSSNTFRRRDVAAGVEKSRWKVERKTR